MIWITTYDEIYLDWFYDEIWVDGDAIFVWMSFALNVIEGSHVGIIHYMSDKQDNTSLDTKYL